MKFCLMIGATFGYRVEKIVPICNTAMLKPVAMSINPAEEDYQRLNVETGIDVELKCPGI